MSAPCAVDPGYVVNGSTYYEQDTDVDSESYKFALKAFTTEVASNFMLTNNIDFHWDLVNTMSHELKVRNLGTVYVKGGLALHIVLRELMKKWRQLLNTGDYARLKEITEYMNSKYSAPSDLDTGVDVPDLGDLPEVRQILKSVLERSRGNFYAADAVLQGIVDECNTSKDVLMSNDAMINDGIVDINFFVAKQSDQSVRASDPSDPNCKFSKCVIVDAGAEHTIFQSENESLMFRKGQNTADFYLYRAKWSIAATLTLSDGSTCESTCPAELLDVAIPRAHDSQRRLNADKGMNVMHDDVDVSLDDSMPIYVSAVSLRYQLLDLNEMIHESIDHLRSTGTVQDLKIGKRVYRWLALMTIQDAGRQERLETSPNSWRELLDADHRENVANVCDFMDEMISTGFMTEDAVLFEAMCDLRSIMDIGASGGGRGGVSITSAVCIATTFAMAILGSI
jgi:hypothetical protein